MSNWRLNVTNKYSHLLMVMAVLFLIFPFMEDIKTEISILSFVFIIVIIFALRALKISQKIFYSFIFFVFAASVTDFLLWQYADPFIRKIILTTTLIIYSFILLLSAVTMLRSIFSSQKVTADIVRGGISIYLLLGFLWTLFYYIVVYNDKGAFSFSEPTNYVYLMYYSFTTLTTVGYGDIFPVNKFAMSLSNLEAIVGQLYMGIFVSRLVGLHIIHHEQTSSL